MNEDNSIGGLIAIAFLIWLGVSMWGWIFPTDSDMTPNSSYSDNSSNDYKEDCTEPENPYDYDSGHYAGFEWGENGNSCGGDSNSFIEGCEEYESQQEAYNACLERN